MAAECGCPDIYPDWDDKDVDLGGCPVIELRMPMFMHMPLAHDLYAGRQQQLIERMEMQEPWPRLLLTRTGMLRGSLLRLLTPGTSSPSRFFRTLPFPFVARGKLHHGNLSTGHKVIREMQMRLVDEGCRPRELYIAYLSCPACIERRGEKILFLRRWNESAILKNRRLKRETETVSCEDSATVRPGSGPAGIAESARDRRNGS